MPTLYPARLLAGKLGDVGRLSASEQLLAGQHAATGGERQVSLGGPGPNWVKMGSILTQPRTSRATERRAFDLQRRQFYVHVRVRLRRRLAGDQL